jgi:chromate transporter
MSPLPLGWIFLRIGAVAFGGLGATLTLIEHELVERRGLTSKAEITEALTYTKLLPGSTVVQVVAYLAWRLAGWRGSAAATAGFILPAAILMVLLGIGYAHVAGVPAIAPVRHGVLSAVVALLLVTMYRLARPLLTTPLNIGLALGAFAVVTLLNVGVVWVVLAAGIVGLATACRRP